MRTWQGGGSREEHWQTGPSSSDGYNVIDGEQGPGTTPLLAPTDKGNCETVPMADKPPVAVCRQAMRR